jgi:hypothetical protein
MIVSSSWRRPRRDVIGKENYFLSADGLLMPAKKDQPPPDLRYFKQTQK